MGSGLKLCLNIDGDNIYEFSGKMNEQSMIAGANYIERLLLEKSVSQDKIQNVFELFIETIQNILNYSSNSVKGDNNKREVSCDCVLSYFTDNNTYILESCNLIHKHQKKIIEEKVNAIKNLDKQALRKLIRKHSRSKEKKHDQGAGLGYILMALKSSLPIEIKFIKFDDKTLKYRQKLVV